MNGYAVFLDALTASAARYLAILGMSSEEMPGSAGDGLQLDDITSFIQLSGGMEGGFLFTVEKKLAVALAMKYILGEPTEAEAAEAAVEVIAEIANVITGNALSGRKQHDVAIGHPLMVVSAKAEVRAGIGKVFVRWYATPRGSFRCIYMPKNDQSAIAGILAGEPE